MCTTVGVGVTVDERLDVADGVAGSTVKVTVADGTLGPGEAVGLGRVVGVEWMIGRSTSVGTLVGLNGGVWLD